MPRAPEVASLHADAAAAAQAAAAAVAALEQRLNETITLARETEAGLHAQLDAANADLAATRQALAESRAETEAPPRLGMPSASRGCLCGAC